MLKQFAVLPVLWLSGKIDFKDQQNLITLQVVFGTIITAGYCMIQLSLSRARVVNNTARVVQPGKSMYLLDEHLAADGSCSACAYDMAKLKESKMQFVMGAAIGAFMFLGWGWTQPLLVMSVTQPLALLDNKALLIYMRGHVYERPWAAANADNPLAQWAERKQAEAEASKLEDKDKGKKKD